MEKNTSFTFAGYQSDIHDGVVRFHYQLSDSGRTYDFTETITFPSERECSIDPVLLDGIIKNLFLMLGISYWKTFCPQTIIISSFSLSTKQAKFWNTVYTEGLGEFYYRNHIDFRSLVHFSSDESVQDIVRPSLLSDRSLVLLGGGKDSIVTAECMKAAGLPFSFFCLNETPVHTRVAAASGKPVLSFQRHIDPKLLALNSASGVYNGHVPYVAILSFISIFAAALYDYRFIVASNERSANYGNVEYLGHEINHQWSKSFEFENLFSDYIRTTLTPDISYFSLLRPLTEFHITKEFIRYPEYFPLFTSCNSNFKILSNGEKTLWCGKCAKCAFVFLLLAAFLSKEKVVSIFGKNLFTNLSLVQTYKDLAGLGSMKPFECVGTPDEVQYAFIKVLQNDEYKSDPVVRALGAQLPHDFEKIKTLEMEVFKKGAHKISEKFVSRIATL